METLLFKERSFYMSESQVINAMQFLSKLYAESRGFQNPQITITKENKKKEEETA